MTLDIYEVKTDLDMKGEINILEIIAIMKISDTSLFLKRLQRCDCFFSEHIVQNCQNSQTAIHKKVVCTGKKKSQVCNRLIERDLFYIFINAI